MAGKDPYMPKTLRMTTGKGTAYVAPIFPVRVMTILQIAKPKKTIGMVSLAVKPSAITLLTVAARGGASMSEHLGEGWNQYPHLSLLYSDLFLTNTPNNQ
jgi:hypothetical protein